MTHAPDDRSPRARLRSLATAASLLGGAYLALAVGHPPNGGAPLARAMTGDPAPRAPREVESTPPADWQSEVEQRIVAGEYAIRPNSTGGFRARNRAQSLVTHFEPDGAVRVEFGDAGSGPTLRTTRVAATELAEHPPSSGLGACRADGALDERGDCLRRLEMARGGVVEWWENRPDGLQHGYDILAPQGGGDVLAVEVAVEAGRFEVVGPHATDGRIVGDDGAVLEYAGLTAWDADGRVLASRLRAVPAQGFRIEVEVSGARYPVRIDPVLTPAPAWRALDEGIVRVVYSDDDSLSAAGDVNGDGYGDVVIGRPVFDGGETREGRAYLYLGSASGLSTNASWMVESDQEFAEFGSSVVGAGDVNGDGFADVLVGAWRFTNGEAEEGAAFLYLGGANGLATMPAWTTESNDAFGYLGRSVAGAGDVNGDGYSDVLVGAYGFDNEGSAYLFLGGEQGLEDEAAWRAEGDQVGSSYGYSVASAGDVNADGYGDIIVGARLFDGALVNEGRAYVYLGGVDGVASAPVWTVGSDVGDGYFGDTVSGAGDVNGDGYADVMVSEPFFQGGTGRVHVFLGDATGLSAVAAWVGGGRSAQPLFGREVASAGDVNGDGYGDVVIGAPWYANGQATEGRVYLFVGGPSGLQVEADWTDESNAAGQRLGSNVSGAGDVNGDGYSDVLAGWPARLYLGCATGPLSLSAWGIQGSSENARLGTSVASAGDVNGDGFGDVVVGAPFYDGGETEEGRAFVFLGDVAGLAHTAAWSAQPDQSGAHFGMAVTTAGDVDGDGYADVLIGAPGYDGGEVDEGRAYVFRGGTSGVAATPAWTGESDQAVARYGSAVAGALDFDGDGYSDIVVGAPGFDATQESEGAAFAYRGGPSGPTGLPAWMASSGQQGALFGSSLAALGDTNGDGFGDLAVGVPDFDGAFKDQGMVAVFLGGEAGLSSSIRLEEDEQLAALFGYSVGAAGDVNGDGYADLVVGAPRHDGGELDEGRAFVFHGGATGLSAAAAWRGEANQANARFGYAVGSAGDVNGDGFGDVIVGAPAHDDVHVDGGRVFVFSGSAVGLSSQAGWSVGSDAASTGFGESVASAGDVNGDGYGDVVIGAPRSGAANEGSLRVYLGNGVWERASAPQLGLLRRGDERVLAPGNLVATDDLTARLRAMTPYGRVLTRFELEVKALGQPFDGLGTVLSPAWEASFTPDGGFADLRAWAGELAGGVSYHVRARLRYAPSSGQPATWSRWIYAAPSGAARGDHVRTLPCAPGEYLDTDEQCRACTQCAEGMVEIDACAPRQDTVCSVMDVDAGGPLDSDAGVAADASVTDGSVDVPRAGDGCGCRVASGRSEPRSASRSLGLLLLLVGLRGRRWARRKSARVEGGFRTLAPGS